MPRYDRIELWTDTKAGSGTALGVLNTVEGVLGNERITGDETLVVTILKSDPMYSSLLERKVLRQVFSDGSSREWRLLGPWEEADDPKQGTLVALTGVSMRLSLAECGPCGRTEADGSVTYCFEALGLTVTQLYNNFLAPTLSAAGISYTSLVASQTATMDVVFKNSTVLEICNRIAELLNTEFRYVMNSGGTGYELRFETINSGLSLLQARLGKNVRAVKRARRSDQQATRVYPTGTELDGITVTMAHAQWKVAGLSGSQLQLTDPAGGDSALAYDNQLNNYYLRKVDGSFTQITAGAVSTQLITVASAAGIANGDLVEVRLSNTPAAPLGDGTHLTYLEAPAAKASYGLTARVLGRPDIPDTVNALANASLAAWSSGLPISFALEGSGAALGIGVTISQITTSNRWLTGGSSALLQLVRDGTGLGSAWTNIVPTQRDPAFSAMVNFWIDGPKGRMRVELLLGKATVAMHATAGTAITRSTVSGVTTVTCTTASAHGLATGDTVEITGVTPSNYNGQYSVTVVSSTVFTWVMYTDPGACTTSGTTRWVRVWPDGTNALAFSDAVNTWVTLAVAGIEAKTLGATVAKVRCVQDGPGVTSSVTSISNSGTTATVTQTAHGYVSGNRIFIQGASLSANNGDFIITFIDADHYSYTMGSSPGSNPTGTITATKGTTVYIDSFQLTQTASSVPFLVGSGGTRLWQAANRALLQFAQPLVKYDIDLIDLERLDPTSFAAEAIALGQSIHVVDEELGADVTTRILELQRDWINDTVTRVTLSDRPDDLTDTVLGRLPPARQVPTFRADLTMQVMANWQTKANVPNSVTMILSALPQGCTIYWWRGGVGELPPPIGTVVATGGNPTSTAWAPYSAAVAINRDQTNDIIVFAYALTGNRVSPVFSWKVDKDPSASLSDVTISQITSPANGMKVTWAVDTDVAWVDVYTRRDTTLNWPTQDSTQTGLVDKTYYRGRFHPSATGLGWDASGNTIYGALSFSDTTAYPWANTNKFAVILVPIDRNMNVGTRVEISGTYVTTPPGSITAFTWDNPDFSGSTNSSVRLNWTLANGGGTPDATYDLNLYYRVSHGGSSFGSWILITTITNPYTVVNYTWTGADADTSGKFDPNVDYQFKAELVNTVPTIVDTQQNTNGDWIYQSLP